MKQSIICARIEAFYSPGSTMKRQLETSTRVKASNRNWIALNRLLANTFRNEIRTLSCFFFNHSSVMDISTVLLIKVLFLSRTRSLLAPHKIIFLHFDILFCIWTFSFVQLPKDWITFPPIHTKFHVFSRVPTGASIVPMKRTLSSYTTDWLCNDDFQFPSHLSAPFPVTIIPFWFTRFWT